MEAVMSDIYSDALKAALIKRRTEKEVSEILQKKGYGEDEAKEAAAYYREKGYIDHEDFAVRYSHDAAYIKGQGPVRIRRTLKEKGIEDEIIEKALSETKFEIKSLMAKKYGEGVDKTYKEIVKIKNHFYLKGFPMSLIDDAIKELYRII